MWRSLVVRGATCSVPVYRSSETVFTSRRGGGQQAARSRPRRSVLTGVVDVEVPWRAVVVYNFVVGLLVVNPTGWSTSPEVETREAACGPMTQLDGGTLRSAGHWSTTSGRPSSRSTPADLEPATTQDQLPILRTYSRQDTEVQVLWLI